MIPTQAAPTPLAYALPETVEARHGAVGVVSRVDSSRRPCLLLTMSGVLCARTSSSMMTSMSSCRRRRSSQRMVEGESVSQPESAGG
jgi:hypothetical protein